jgi:hypothetical protein
MKLNNIIIALLEQEKRGNLTRKQIIRFIKNLEAKL